MRKVVNFVHLINGLVVAGEFLKMIFNVKLMQNSILLSFFGTRQGRREARGDTLNFRLFNQGLRVLEVGDECSWLVQGIVEYSPSVSRPVNF